VLLLSSSKHAAIEWLEYIRMKCLMIRTEGIKNPILDKFEDPGRAALIPDCFRQSPSPSGFFFLKKSTFDEHFQTPIRGLCSWRGFIHNLISDSSQHNGASSKHESDSSPQIQTQTRLVLRIQAFGVI
jgi:hypothetical protein